MKITMFGTGYVGLVTGACFADAGHDVLCVDVDEAKVANLNNGVIPIHEPGLEAIVVENLNNGQLKFSTSAEEGVYHADLIIIAVGTPPDEDGSADLTYVLTVADTIACLMLSHKIVVVKSTVPVGTSDDVRRKINDRLSMRKSELTFEVASNPEFLKEGAAVSDFQKPDRIIIGTKSENVRAVLTELYQPFNRNHSRLVFMDERSSELTKYAANAMLATKISFMNEIANLAEKLGADIEQVRHGIGSDQRIGYHFIYPGCGYGGSCFPKDVKALIATAEENGFDPVVLRAVEARNRTQKGRLFTKLHTYFKGAIDKKVIAVWGLAFKPNTDDMRDAPSLYLIEGILKAGGSVRAYDPESMDEAHKIFGEQGNLSLVSSKEAALKGADALVICTEWRHFRSPDFDMIKNELSTPVIIDGRNLYEPSALKEQGFYYAAIGRGESE